MSAYYSIANHTKRQWFDPDRVGSGVTKLERVAFLEAGRLLAYVMATGWRGDHVVVLRDDDPEYQRVEREYEDATDRVAGGFNHDRPWHVEAILVRPRGTG